MTAWEIIQLFNVKYLSDEEKENIIKTYGNKCFLEGIQFYQDGEGEKILEEEKILKEEKNEELSKEDRS